MYINIFNRASTSPATVPCKSRTRAWSPVMSAGALTLLGPWLITKIDFFLPKLLILNDLLFVERHYSWCSTNIADLWLIAFLSRSKVCQHQGAKRQKSSFLGYSYHVTLRVVVYQTVYAYGALWILVISYLLMNSCHSFTFSLQGCFIGPLAVMHIQRDTEGYDQRRPLPSHNKIRDYSVHAQQMRLGVIL